QTAPQNRRSIAGSPRTTRIQMPTRTASVVRLAPRAKPWNRKTGVSPDDVARPEARWLISSLWHATIEAGARADATAHKGRQVTDEHETQSNIRVKTWKAHATAVIVQSGPEV